MTLPGAAAVAAPLGDRGATGDRGEPGQVIAFRAWRDVQTLVMLEGGECYHWGLNDDGQLEDGTKEHRSRGHAWHRPEATQHI